MQKKNHLGFFSVNYLFSVLACCGPPLHSRRSAFDPIQISVLLLMQAETVCRCIFVVVWFVIVVQDFCECW